MARGDDLDKARYERGQSSFRQGCILYDLISMMPEDRLRPLMQRFSLMLQEQPLFADVSAGSDQ